jgi:hypothetical protein
LLQRVVAEEIDGQIKDDRQIKEGGQIKEGDKESRYLSKKTTYHYNQ